MKTFNARDLNRLVTIERRTHIDDAEGTEEWTLLGPPTPVGIKPVRGTETVVGNQMQSTTTHRVIMRYRDDIDSSCRLRDDIKGRYLEIQSIIDVEERYHWLQLMCKEVPIPLGAAS